VQNNPAHVPFHASLCTERPKPAHRSTQAYVQKDPSVRTVSPKPMCRNTQAHQSFHASLCAEQPKPGHSCTQAYVHNDPSPRIGTTQAYVQNDPSPRTVPPKRCTRPGQYVEVLGLDAEFDGVFGADAMGDVCKPEVRIYLTTRALPCSSRR
jgi:hypothetical protein